ncbi:clasp N terminal-domain-containing protein [Cladochytrium replicatum]|nr:clasp N terminal-domain-containing protein [Cladochytrium replicatum]
MDHEGINNLLEQFIGSDEDVGDRIEALAQVEKALKGTKFPSVETDIFHRFVETLSQTLLNLSNEKLHLQCLSLITSLSKSISTSPDPASLLNVLSASIAPSVVLLLGDSRSKIRDGSQKAFAGIYATIVKTAAAAGGSVGAEGSVGPPYASMLQVLNATIEQGGLRSKNPKAREQALLCILQCHTKVELFTVRIFLSSILKMLDDSSIEVRSTAQEVIICVCNSPKNNVPEVEIRRMVKDLKVSQANANILFSGLAGEPIDLQTTSVQPPTGGVAMKKSNSNNSLNGGKDKGTPIPRTASLPSLGECIEPLNVYAPKELISIFESILHDLSVKETEENWTAKNLSLIKLRRLLRGNAVRMGPFVVQLKQCIEPICNALQSPRTALLKTASAAVVEICECFGNVFEQSVAETLLSTAHKLCSQTNKVVIQAGQDAAGGIIVNINFSAKNMLILEKPFQSVRTTRASQRLSSIFVARTMVETAEAVSSRRIELEKIEKLGMLQLEKLIKLGCADPDRDVREAGRCLFLSYQRIWKERAEALLPTFEPAVKKAISTQKPGKSAVRIASLESVTKPPAREDSMDDDSSYDSNFASYETPRRSKSELPLPRWQTETKQTRTLRPRSSTGNLSEGGSARPAVRVSKHAATVGPVHSLRNYEQIVLDQLESEDADERAEGVVSFFRHIHGQSAIAAGTSRLRYAVSSNDLANVRSREIPAEIITNFSAAFTLLLTDPSIPGDESLLKPENIAVLVTSKVFTLDQIIPLLLRILGQSISSSRVPLNSDSKNLGKYGGRILGCIAYMKSVFPADTILRALGECINGVGILRTSQSSAPSFHGTPIRNSISKLDSPSVLQMMREGRSGLAERFVAEWILDILEPVGLHVLSGENDDDECDCGDCDVSVLVHEMVVNLDGFFRSLMNKMVAMLSVCLDKPRFGSDAPAGVLSFFREPRTVRKGGAKECLLEVLKVLSELKSEQFDTALSTHVGAGELVGEIRRYLGKPSSPGSMDTGKISAMKWDGDSFDKTPGPKAIGAALDASPGELYRTSHSSTSPTPAGRVAQAFGRESILSQRSERSNGKGEQHLGQMNWSSMMPDDPTNDVLLGAEVSDMMNETLPEGFADTSMIGNQSFIAGADSEEVTPKQSPRIAFEDDEEVEALDEMRLSMLAPTSPVGDIRSISTCTKPVPVFNPRSTSSSESSNSAHSERKVPRAPIRWLETLQHQLHEVQTESTEKSVISALEEIEKGSITERLVRQLVSIIRDNKVHDDGSGLEDAYDADRDARARARTLWANQFVQTVDTIIKKLNQSSTSSKHQLWLLYILNELFINQTPLFNNMEKRMISILVECRSEGLKDISGAAEKAIESLSLFFDHRLVLKACLELLDAWDVNMRLQKDLPRQRRNQHMLNSTNWVNIETPARYHPAPTVSVFVIIGRILPRFGPEELGESDFLSRLARIGVKGLRSKIAEVRRTALSCLTDLHEWIANAEQEAALPGEMHMNDSLVGTDQHFHRLWIHHVIQEQHLSLKEQLLVRIQMMRRQLEEKDPNIPELLSQSMFLPLPA